MENLNKISEIYNLIQSHTILIYNLENRDYIRKVINARELLHVSRFDLFAKLYYAKNRFSHPDTALDVYIQHIKIFNPDFCEPGRTDKTSLDSFITTYNYLLDYFKDNDFDDTISIVPVDEDGVILDGAHRVAALAFHNKNVTIVQFKGIKSKGPFDYVYFKERGLQWNICDLIASEISLWKDDILMACLWPQMGDGRHKDIAVEYLKSKYKVCYQTEATVSIKSLELLIPLVYASQPWVNSHSSVLDKSINCFGRTNRTVRFVLMQTSLSLDETIEIKEYIRDIFKSGKHSVHITDNNKETRELSQIVFTPEGCKLWKDEKIINSIREQIKERWYYFRNVELLKIKVLIAKFIDLCR